MGIKESEVYKILNLTEDYVLDGFRHDHPPLTSGPSRQQMMEHIARQVAGCTRCALHRERRKTVAGEGAIDPLVMVIGEGPGAEEDRRYNPMFPFENAGLSNRAPRLSK